MTPLLEVSVGGGVATLTLDRPEKRNALSIELRHALADALRGLPADVRWTVITGRGTAFCAGMDTTQFGTDKQGLVDSTEAMVGALLDHPRPLVAAVNGPAMGGGFVLALLCDIRVATPEATFGFPEVHRGIPGSYGAARMALPRGVAADLALTGRVIDAEEALRLGVVSRIVERDALTTAVDIPAAQIDWLRHDRGDARALLEAERDAFRTALLG